MTKKSKRDNFSSAVVRALRNRVNNTCSNPSCRRITQGPHSDPNKANNTGIAAHVTAAAVGGPRYDPALSQAQRKSIDNAIWLCGVCDKKVDRDPKTYPTETLRSWKTVAEAAADREHGSRLHRDEDMRDAVQGALTGFPQRLIPNAIRNIHAAQSAALEQLDPRLRVSTAFYDNTEVISVRARDQDVPFTLVLNVDPASNARASYESLLKVGQDFVVDTREVEFMGSPLLEDLARRHTFGRVTIASSQKIDAITKTYLVSPEGERVPFEDFPGHVASGTHGVSIRGSCFKGILSLAYEIYLTDTGGSVSVLFDFKSWQGRPVTHLPYFEKLKSFVERVVDGWHFSLELEIDGRSGAITTPIALGKREYFHVLNQFLNYTQAAIPLSKLSKSEIIFQQDYVIPKGNFTEVVEAGNIALSQRRVERDQLKSNPALRLEVVENTREILESFLTPATLILEERVGSALKIFDQTIKLPPKSTIFDKFQPKCTADWEKVRVGDSVSVELLPLEGSVLRWEYGLRI